ncbi:tRNA pseudouridine synthase 3, partial [Lunasporangiospora selenospora]
HGVPATSRPAAAAVVGPTLTKADIQQGKDSNTAASTPQSNQENVEESGRKRKLKDRRPFDFSKYAKRHIALRIAYFGWPYGGFASQGINEIKTVESELFNALLAGRLIDDPQNCDYSRCGRTDRGVSGLGQVVALTVRSSLPKDSPFVIQPKPEGEEGGATETDKNNVEQKTEEEQEREWAVLEAEESTKGELAYISMINRLLPPDIRVLAWTPVPEDFNARFNCDWREYKYFFPRGTIDIDRMRLGAKKYLGAHDFRNFCKFDNTKEITNYERVVLDIRIDPVPGYEFPEHSGRQFYELTLRGTAFLWHQVRCMMSVLFTIGHGLEEPEVIDALMDVENCPAKPTYDMASDLPLVLYDCHFKRVKWLYQTEVGVSSQNDMMAMRLYRSMEDAWSSHMIKSLMYSRLLSRMDQATLLNINEAGEKVKLGEHAEQNAHKETSISLGADLRMFMGKGYNKLMGRQKCLPIAEKSKRQQEKKRQKLALLDSEVNSSAENTDVDSSPAVVEKQTDATA